MMTQIEAAAVGSDIELRLSDEIDNALFRLDTHEVMHLLLKLCQGVGGGGGGIEGNGTEWESL